MSVRFPLTLRNGEDLLFEKVLSLVVRPQQKNPL